jgi:hypothetical protein
MGPQGRTRVVLGIVVLSGALMPWRAAAGPLDSRVSDQTFVRHDGGSDAGIARCNDPDPSTGSSNERVNEPSVAIDPGEPSFIAAGANEYCSDALRRGWQGLATSNDGGLTWTDSLVPGYPEDTSVEGQESPAFGRSRYSTDPVMDWDNDGRLYYGFIAFNREKPNNGDALVARFQRDPGSLLGIDYLGTALIDLGTPGDFLTGHSTTSPD